MRLVHSHPEETLSGFCRQIAHKFGAWYCQIILARDQSLAAGAEAGHEIGATRFVSGFKGTPTVLPAGRIAGAIQSTGNNVDEEDQGGDKTGADSECPGNQETLSTLHESCQSAQPVLQFELYPHITIAARRPLLGYLILAFRGPQSFSRSELAALLAVAEMASLLLCGATLEPRGNSEMRATAERLMSGINGNLFESPFIKAKRFWTDAFEREYLFRLLTENFGNISKVARTARVSRYTVYALLNKYQLSAKPFKKKSLMRSPDAGERELDRDTGETMPSPVASV